MVKPFAALMVALAAPAAAVAATPPAMPAAAPHDLVSGAFRFPDRPLWAGAVFDLKLVWTVDWDKFRALEGDPTWTPDPLVIDGWTRDPPGAPVNDYGKSIAQIGLTTHALALKPGKMSLNPARQTLQLVTGGYQTDSVQIATIGEASATSDKAVLTIRPLPPAPQGFSGAVGDFKLTSSLGAAKAEVGKPVAWTLTLSGVGNWTAFSGVPARPLPDQFDVVGKPEPSQQNGAGLFERSVSERLVIVPRASGHFVLGPVDMMVFDPSAGRYTTISAPALALDVAANPHAAPTAPADQAASVQGPVGEPLPAPFNGKAEAWAPLGRPTWRFALALPFAGFAGLWGALAWRRARQSDPLAAARKADRRLRQNLRNLAVCTDEAQRRRLVRDWQRSARVRLGVGLAAPDSGAFRDPAWASLWDEAELYLYARAQALAPDWPARAEAALAAAQAVPRFNPWSAAAWRNLYPAAALIALVLMTAAPSSGRAELSARAPAPPRDWIAHYNLALDAARSGRWVEAAAQAEAAWVQAPQVKPVRQLWVRAAREAGVSGAAAGALPSPDSPAGAFAGLLPPLAWEASTLILLFVAACCGGLFLLERFERRPRRATAAAPVIAAIALAGALVSFAGVQGYGLAAYAEAAIVRRQVPLRDLPVDTPDDESAVSLAPGACGLMGRSFMGWVRLTLPAGRVGWVRKSDLLPLWRDPPS